MSSVTAWVAPDLAKALAILSETNIKRSAGETYIQEIEKNHLLKWSKFLDIDNKFSKDFTNYKENTTWVVVSHNQLQAIIEGTVSLTCCYSLG